MSNAHEPLAASIRVGTEHEAQDAADYISSHFGGATNEEFNQGMATIILAYLKKYPNATLIDVSEALKNLGQKIKKVDEYLEESGFAPISPN